jgi:hypothetical protein
MRTIMGEQLKVGDVVIGQHFTVNLECNGQEAVVISPVKLGIFNCADGSVGFFHACEILWADGCQEWQKPYRLHLRKPPASDANERMHVQKWRDMAGKAPQRVGETV